MTTGFLGFVLLTMVHACAPSATTLAQAPPAPAARPQAGWLAPASARQFPDAETAVRSAPVIAIVRVVATGDRCMNSIRESLIADVVEVTRGSHPPRRVVARDNEMGFPHGDHVGLEGTLLVAALSPAGQPQSITLEDNCMGRGRAALGVDGTSDAFFVTSSLAKARALAAELAR